MKKTIENLTKAFIGESQARNRYTFYASKARKEGFEQIGEIFGDGISDPAAIMKETLEEFSDIYLENR